ncbi:AIPR family protein [Verrucomicrobiales bacterium]|nr:AIPR family protein [Verrucomicrobiales bacterium]
MSDTLEFFRDLQSEVMDFSMGGGDGDSAGFKEGAFTSIVAEDLSAAGIVESPVSCYFETGPQTRRAKINGYSVPEDDTQLDLIFSLYGGGEEPLKLASKEVNQAYSQLTRGLEKALKGHHEHMEPGSDAFAMVHDIWSKREQFDRIRLLLLTDGVVVQRKESERKDSVGGYQVTYEIWDIERFRRFRSSGASHESIEVDLSHFPEGGVPCVQVANDDMGYATSAAVFPGKLLYELYDDYGQRLLELNVRSYLQARGKINGGILETLFEAPERFLAYNNGITIVAEEIDVGPLNNGDPGIRAIKGLQIVNGGQTTASIHRAGKGENGIARFRGKTADLEKVFVQAKVTVIERSQFDTLVPLISRFSNSQNKVSEVDLRANHPFHVGIERASRKTWAPGEQSMWFYERARGSYQTKKAAEASTPARKRDFEKRYPPSQKFSKEDLARYENCWHGEPHIVSRGGQKNFASFMTRVGNTEEGWVPAADEYRDLIGRAILYKQIQKTARDLQIPAFRANVVSYTMASIAHQTAKRIDLQTIWDNQKVSPALAETLEEWIPLIEREMVRSVGERNPTEWFKNKGCWDVVQTMDLPVSSALSGELIGGADVVVKKRGRGGKVMEISLSVEDQNNIARCRELSSGEWHEIVEWGAETGSLKAWQSGIASTLSGYAAGGWSKSPSPKQAKHGCAMIEAWKKR